MPNKKSVTKKDQYTVVLEDIRSQNKAFGEGLSVVRREVKEVGQQVEKLDQRVEGLDQKVGGLDQRLERVESDMGIVKNELALIRHNQVTRDEFKFLETRVLRLEKQRH